MENGDNNRAVFAAKRFSFEAQSLLADWTLVVICVRQMIGSLSRINFHIHRGEVAIRTDKLRLETRINPALDRPYVYVYNACYLERLITRKDSEQKKYSRSFITEDKLTTRARANDKSNPRSPVPPQIVLAS